mgnify:CR=1 FL=1
MLSFRRKKLDILHNNSIIKLEPKSLTFPCIIFQIMVKSSQSSSKQRSEGDNKT